MTARGVFDGKSLLYVEDDPILAKETVARLGLMGFGDIRIACDLCQVEALVKDFRFDIALLDVHLGMSTTIDIAAQLAETGAHIVFTSGYDRSELGDRLGDFAFLAKPYTFGQLSVALENAGEEQIGSLAAE